MASPTPRSPMISTMTQQDRRHGDEDDPQISERQRRRLGRRREQRAARPARASQPSTAIAMATGRKPPIARADHPPRPIDVARAERLADQHRRRHAEAEDEGHQQEHDHIGVGGRGERVLAEEAADPDRVDRAVERLQDRGEQGRHREGEQDVGPIARRMVQHRACARARARHQPEAAPARRDISPRRRPSRHDRRAPSPPPRASRARRSSGLARRAASESRSFSAASAALARRDLLGVDVDHAFERQDEGRLVDHDLRRAAFDRRRR